jgi:hypothetical protein
MAGIVGHATDPKTILRLSPPPGIRSTIFEALSSVVLNAMPANALV